jgi:hypothetical protein
MFKLLLFLVALVGLWTIVPLLLKGGTGGWRRALTSLRYYVNLAAVVLVVAGALGLAFAAAQYFKAR